MPKIDDIGIYQGYGGVPKVEAKIGEEWFVIEKGHAERLLLEIFNSKGFTVTKTAHQKYPRITANQ